MPCRSSANGARIGLQAWICASCNLCMVHWTKHEQYDIENLKAFRDGRISHCTDSSIYMYPITAASHVTMGGVPNMNPK